MCKEIEFVIRSPLIFISSFLLTACSTQITKERFILSMPILHIDSSIEDFKTDFAVITYKDIKLYELPYRESFQVNDSLVSDTISYEYFIFKKEDSHGFLLRDITGQFEKKYKVDSILIPRAYYHVDFDSFISFPKNKYKGRKNTQMQCRIVYSTDKPGIDSIAAYFDPELNGLNLSLSKTLDDLLNAKLYKIEWWLNPAGYSGKQLLRSMEIRKVGVDNTTDILNFIKRYEKK